MAIDGERGVMIIGIVVRRGDCQRSDLSYQMSLMTSAKKNKNMAVSPVFRRLGWRRIALDLAVHR